MTNLHSPDTLQPEERSRNVYGGIEPSRGAGAGPGQGAALRVPPRQDGSERFRRYQSDDRGAQRCVIAPMVELGETMGRAMLDLETAADQIRQHGLVLESAKGPLPRLVELIAEEPIEGSWWSHPGSRHIFAVLSELREREDLLVFRLVRGKLTYAHRWVWPALVALAGQIDHGRLAAIQDIHTAAGHHETIETPFPDWVPGEVIQTAQALSETQARQMVGAAID